MDVPEDFDAFWAAQKARLAAVPMNLFSRPSSRPIQRLECFDVQIPCVEPPSRLRLLCPAGQGCPEKPARYPVPCTEPASAVPAGVDGIAKSANCLAMDINAHGIPNGKPAQYYEDLKNGELKDYRAFGREDRGQCYFLGMFLRMLRALDFLTSQPEWDGKILIVRGGSQGGRPVDRTRPAWTLV